MGTFTRGDIVVFPFPFTDLSAKKIRPCLVLSKEMNEDILLCQITSNSLPKDEYTIELKKEDTKKGNLMIDSYVRTNMLFTGTREQIKKKIDSIEKEKYEKVVEKLIEIISPA